MNKNELREAISEQFAYVDKEDLKVSEAEATVKFETTSEEITYVKLCALSGLLGTVKIRVYAETRAGGACDTCAYDYAVIIIEAAEVKCLGEAQAI